MFRLAINCQVDTSYLSLLVLLLGVCSEPTTDDNVDIGLDHMVKVFHVEILMFVCFGFTAPLFNMDIIIIIIGQRRNSC